ncbi:MAG TPA: twin-arginine translocase subunit TatC [Streptosporangiaceae bacterium]|jgi:sec-independent protein translocase protein TatC|nr:twin-arginine translocase subunit TatC [Streptosporangiaceae bacterium]
MTTPRRSTRRVNPEARMSLIEHIRELRNRLLKALLALAAGMGVGWIFFNPVWKFLERPYCKIPQHNRLLGTHGCTLVVNGLFDGFFIHLKIMFVVGLIVSSPVWLYQLWAFIAPGLYARERRWAYAFVGAAVPLFAAGAAFAYLAMSNGLRFLLHMVPSGATALITVDTYFGYMTAMLLIFGIAFEVPLIMVMLNMAGVLTHARMRKWRRLMIFAVFAFAAVAVPSPDPFSMLLLAVPCVVLVELAELFVWANDRRRARRPSVYAGLSDDEISPLDFDDRIDAGPR